MPTRYFTRWPTRGANPDEHADHKQGQVRNGSVLIQRPKLKDWAEYMNGDFMGRLTEPPPGAVEVTKAEFNRWAPNCINPTK